MFWQAAYAEAISEAVGHAWAFPPVARASLRRAVETHCPSLAAADDWLRGTATDFARAAADDVARGDPYDPARFLDWLNRQARERASQSRTRSALPPLPPEPEPEPMTPEERAELEAILAPMGMSPLRRQALEDDRNHVPLSAARIVGLDDDSDAKGAA